MRYRFCIISPIVLTVGVLVQSAAGATPPQSACTFLSLTQLSAALGTPMIKGQQRSPSDGTYCQWREAGASVPDAKTVTVTTGTVDAYERAKNVSTVFRVAPVSGIGAEAYMTSANLSYGASLSVLKDGVAFIVTVRGFPDLGTVEEKEKAIARLLGL